MVFGIDPDGSQVGGHAGVYCVGLYRPLAGDDYPAYLTIQLERRNHFSAIEGWLRPQRVRSCCSHPPTATIGSTGSCFCAAQLCVHSAGRRGSSGRWRGVEAFRGGRPVSGRVRESPTVEDGSGRWPSLLPTPAGAAGRICESSFSTVTACRSGSGPSASSDFHRHGDGRPAQWRAHQAVGLASDLCRGARQTHLAQPWFIEVQPETPGDARPGPPGFLPAVRRPDRARR